MNIITVQNVTKRYNRHVILSDISLNFEAGLTHGIIGMNGCGKSVLLQLISGLSKPDSGSIIVNGKRLGRDMDFPEDMGILINGPAFIANYSAYTNLSLLAAYRGIAGKDTIERMIQTVGLNPKDRKSVGKFSSGMKARLGIAQAIMENPSLLLLDEPFNGLDKQGLIDMRNVIQSLKNEGKTILLTSHDPRDIDMLCDRVIRIEDGQAYPVDRETDSRQNERAASV